MIILVINQIRKALAIAERDFIRERNQYEITAHKNIVTRTPGPKAHQTG